LLDELKALIAFSQTGSMEAAARSLYLTPSAMTRRIQRLESELGAVLVDRRFKPPRLTHAGTEVLASGHGVLSSLNELRASLSGTTVPAGTFSLGMSHALAQPDISKAIIQLSKAFPLLQPCISSCTSSELVARLRANDLHGALVVFPTQMAIPDDLESVELACERIRFVQARTSIQRKDGNGSEFYRRSWVLNPTGCLVRSEIESRLQRLGVPLTIAAELHNPELQLSLIRKDVGVGALRDSFVRKYARDASLRILNHPSFDLSIRIAFLYCRYLGARERVAKELQNILVSHFRSCR